MPSLLFSSFQVFMPEMVKFISKSQKGLVENNAYFRNMEKFLQERQDKLVELWGNVEKKDEYKAALHNPYGLGADKAHHAWESSLARKEDMLDLTESVFKSEAKEFVQTLRAAGFRAFVCTDDSSGLMRTMHVLAEEGSRFMNFCTVTRRKTRWGDDDSTEKVMGVSFSLD